MGRTKTKTANEKAYEKLLAEVDESNFIPRENCYLCPHCGHVTKTVDINSGISPFMMACEKCNQYARSSFYEDLAPEQGPTWEWYRPELHEFLYRYKTSPQTREHILQGGLMVRPVRELRLCETCTFTTTEFANKFKPCKTCGEDHKWWTKYVKRRRR